MLTTSELIGLALVPIATAAGFTLHELSHYAVGKIAGGNPFFNRFTLGIVPHEVDFETPERMSKNGIRATAGIVYIYPLIAFLLAMVIPQNLVIELAPIWCVFLAASGISWFDALAVQDPERWREYTIGNPISRDSTP